METEKYVKQRKEDINMKKMKHGPNPVWWASKTSSPFCVFNISKIKKAKENDVIIN